MTLIEAPYHMFFAMPEGFGAHFIYSVIPQFLYHSVNWSDNVIEQQNGPSKTM